MARFILLTFGFLGWAFYEMSGGAGFVPRSVEMAANAQKIEAPRRVASAEKRRQMAAESLVQKASFSAADSAPVPVAEDVTRVALNLTTLRDVPVQGSMADTMAQTAVASTGDMAGAKVIKAKMTPGAEAAPMVQKAAVTRTPGSEISSAATPAIIPSLIDPDDGIETAAMETRDIRRVAGTKVNVRGGPGTKYGVLTQLTQGAEVVVLRDTGEGWVKLQSIDSGRVGWMADFLLTEG